MRIPPNHPCSFRIFYEVNHAAMGGTSPLRKPLGDKASIKRMDGVSQVYSVAFTHQWSNMTYSVEATNDYWDWKDRRKSWVS